MAPLTDTRPATRSRPAMTLIGVLIVLATLAAGVFGALLMTSPGGGEPRTPPTTLETR